MLPVLSEATLVVPARTPFKTFGKFGRHSEHMGHLLATMQYMQRTYPRCHLVVPAHERACCANRGRHRDARRAFVRLRFSRQPRPARDGSMMRRNGSWKC